ncbi:hypothetical protein, partial [Klebsiella aerogenes]|uniref:hypothetical protein n=1 Tax=Klebsiella aerogenes TaxID=548 RepID=UPI001954BBE7
ARKSSIALAMGSSTVAGEDYTQNVIFNYGNRTVPVISDINYLTKDFAEFTTYINQNRAFLE